MSHLSPKDRAESRIGVGGWPKFFVGFFAIVAAGYRLTTSSRENPAWLLVLSILAGVACIEGYRRRAPAASASLGWLLVFVLIMASGRQLLMVFLGSLFVAYGVVGLATGKIDVKGRTGPVRRYSGWVARSWSILFALSGSAVLGWALFFE